LRAVFPLPARIGDPLAGPPSSTSGSLSISGRAPSLAAALSFSRLLVMSARTSPSRRQLVFINRLIAMDRTVAETKTKMLGFQSKHERSQMSIDASMTMREYAGQRWPAMNHKGRMSRLATVLGLGHRRVRSIYQNEPGVRLRAEEMAAIRALQVRKIEEANRDDFAALQDRVARLEAALLAVDQEFHQPQMAGLREAIDGGRGRNVAVSAFRRTKGD